MNKSKIQQFYVLNFNSRFLKKHSYKLNNVDINSARINNQIISVAHSQMIDTIFLESRNELPNIDKINKLKKNITKLKSKNNKSIENKKELIKYKTILDNYLYVPEIIVITFENQSHYRKCIKDGVYINKNKYVRLLAGAGHLRRKTIVFILENLFDKVISKFENSIDKTKQINMSKFGAYTGMYASSGKRVSMPYYIVVKDLNIVRSNDIVDFVTKNNNVEKKSLDISLNVFDGMGLISLRMASKWSEELGLEYDAVQFLIRAPYTKGLLVSFPFHLMGTENNISKIVDIYGKEHDLNDVDVILTESQFKLHSHYSSIDAHKNSSLKNDLYWYVSRVNPYEDKSEMWTSYQYLQVLKDGVNIDELTKDTIKYFEDVSNIDPIKSLIYMGGNNDDNKIKTIDDFDNYYFKLLSLNQETINDPYINNHILNTLNKKIKSSYAGKLLIRGNYSFALSDPYALSQHALGIKVTGLLKDNEFYSQYWINKNINKVASGRSPLTWRSEICILNFKNDSEIKKWFGHIYSGVILNIYGNETMKYSDSDFDGDLLWTSDNEEIINNTYGGVPVSYDKTEVSKTNLDYDILPKYEEVSFGTKIGLITNYSTTMYAMLPFFKTNSPEFKELENRLIVCRKLQGSEIDSTKTGIRDKIPEWTKRRNSDNIHNSIILNKRPMFMKYIYPYKNNEFEKHKYYYNIYAWTKYGLSIDELILKKEPTKEESNLIDKYKRYSPLILDSESVMERISRFMVDKVKEIKIKLKSESFDYSIYLSENFYFDNFIYEELKNLLKKYNKIKNKLHYDSMFENKEHVFEYIKNEAYNISYDTELMTNMSVLLCYRDGHNKNFLHDIFGDGVINNVKSKSKHFIVPIKNKKGEFSFMYDNYIIKKIML